MSNLQSPHPIRILIVEDHELARYGLSLSLSEKENMAVVAEAENGQQGVELALEKKPDIILMDIGMPVLDGIAATQQIKANWPESRIIMLTSIQNHNEVQASMAAGADAYCMKDIKIERLQQVIQMVLEGAIWLDPAIARIVMQTLPNEKNTQQAFVEPAPEEPTTGKKKGRIRYNAELTERELEVLKLIVDGKSNKEIARLLDVTDHTAKAHVGSIIQKLSVDDRTQVAVKALREGWV